MPQISFTPRNSDVYDRFSELMMQYQLDHKCKLTAPQFLDLVLDAFEERQAVYAAMQDIEKELQKVIIKQSDGALYLEKMLAHNHNAYLTPIRDKAMVFDNYEQAKTFLRKCGHEVGNWILEPVNESK